MTGAASAGNEILEIPIFPLPNVVLFPNTLLPLHIFESRYRKMVSETIEGNGMIGMALLKQSWDKSDGEDIFSIGGMGEIAEYERMEDGKYDILLRGTHRFRLLEPVRKRPYRISRVQLLLEPLPGIETMSRLSEQIIDSFSDLTRVTSSDARPGILRELDFQTLVNSVCVSLKISDYNKQVLLEIDDLASRAESLLEILQHLLAQHRMVERFSHLRPQDPVAN